MLSISQQFRFRIKSSNKKSTTVGINRTLEWAETELNRRHMDFQSIALPTELSAQNLSIKNNYNRFNLKNHSTVTLLAKFLG